MADNLIVKVQRLRVPGSKVEIAAKRRKNRKNCAAKISYISEFTTI